MRTHALWTIVTGLSLLVCVGCSTTQSGSVIRGQAPCSGCQYGGECLGGGCNYGGCLGGGCPGGACPGGCNPYGAAWNNGYNCSADDGWCVDKWSQSNVHRYHGSMVPQCGVGTAMPMMVQYPYYTTKGPDCFFYQGD